MKTKTFDCICEHVAYYIQGRGWCCMCNQPQRKNKKSILDMKPKKREIKNV